MLVFSQLTVKRVTPLSYKIHGKIKKHMYHFIDDKVTYKRIPRLESEEIKLKYIT